MTITVGVLRAAADAAECRVALVPADARALTGAGLTVLVEAGAGARAWFGDGEYTAAGAQIRGADEVIARAGVLLTLSRVAARPGTLVIGMGLGRPASGTRVLDLTRLPRTLPRGQSMDALTSQAGVAGYRAVLLAASTLPRFFPMMVTAAGTAPPAMVLVLGTGVAGLQAIATARRLGAIVHAYDVRAAARQDAASVGATVLELTGPDDTGRADGYAGALGDLHARDLRDQVAVHAPRYDVVITAAQVRGGPPPLLLTEAAVKSMRAGSVVVDLAVGNAALAEPGRSVVTGNGVTVIGAGDLAGAVPSASSAAYSRNVCNLLRHVIHDGGIRLDPADEIVAATLVTEEEDR